MFLSHISFSSLPLPIGRLPLLGVHGREPRGQEDGRQHKDPPAAQVRRSENQPNQQMKAIMLVSIRMTQPCMILKPVLRLQLNSQPQLKTIFSHNGMTKLSSSFFSFRNGMTRPSFKVNAMYFLTA